MGNIFGSRQELLAWACQVFGDADQAALEFGVFSGSTLSIIRANFPGDVYGFDSFEGLPERWRDGFDKGHFKTDVVPQVAGAEIVVGYFQDTLNDFLLRLDRRIGLLHFDADLYSSTVFCLDAVTGHLADRCVFIFDEFHNYDGFEEHEQKAFGEWLERNPMFGSTVVGSVVAGPRSNGQQVAFVVERGVGRVM